MTTSIQDVAQKAGVSISTVSRSFTRPDLVSTKTRERVLAIADELNFSLSRSAAALKSGRSLRIAVLMSGHIRLWFTASVIEGLNEVLHAAGYDISVFQISSIEERREFFEMLPVRRNADAVIVVSFDIGLTTIRQNPVGMARKAAHMTLDLIEEKPVDEPYVVAPAHLVVRSSTAKIR